MLDSGEGKRKPARGSGEVEMIYSIPVPDSAHQSAIQLVADMVTFHSFECLFPSYTGNRVYLLYMLLLVLETPTCIVGLAGTPPRGRAG